MFAALLAELLDLIAPQRCLDCAGPGVWCQPCREHLVPGRWITASGLSLITPATTSQVMMRAIAEWKDSQRRGLTSVFAEVLGSHLQVALSEFEGALVTIPARRASSRRRGYEPMAELAKAMSARSRGQYRYAPSALRWSVQPAEQRELGDEQRLRNVTGRLRVRALPAENFVLLDDVVTSGSTMLEAARAFAEDGASPAALVALAVPRHSLGQDFVKSVAKR